MSRQDVFNTIVNTILEVMPDIEGHDFSDNDHLEELGANSMDRADIVMMTLEELSLSIPRVEAFGPKTLGELADLLHSKMA